MGKFRMTCKGKTGQTVQLTTDQKGTPAMSCRSLFKGGRVGFATFPTLVVVEVQHELRDRTEFCRKNRREGGIEMSPTVEPLGSKAWRILLPFCPPTHSLQNKHK